MARKKEEKNDVKREEFTSCLKVVLTVEEVADRADRASQKLAERDSKEEEVKAAQKHNKSIIEAMDAELRRLSNEVRTRASYTNVPCVREYNYTKGVVTETRTDTGEVINERKLTAQEAQRTLPFPEESE